MIYFIFASLIVGIIALKIGKKQRWDDYILRRRKERKKEWDKKQKIK